MREFFLLLSGLSALLSVPVMAQELALDLRGVDDALASEPTRVMVLGSTHLGGNESVTSDTLTPLIDRLADFDPQVITIEAVPGETCEMMRSYSSEYQEAIRSYCSNVEPYRDESGMTAAQAANHIRTTLADWPEVPSASNRRRLAAAFLAAGEPYSALVQWWRLPENERSQGDGLGRDSVAALKRYAASMNENASIAARLAARLGLERVHSADDHSADLVYAGHGPELSERLRELWGEPDPALMEGYKAAEQKLSKGRVIEAYQFYNDPETQVMAINGDFRRAIMDKQSRLYGRVYNSSNQVRNLRMVSNIIAAAANAPGSRVLVVVGSTHKFYFEAYLDLMHDIEVVSTDTVLN